MCFHVSRCMDENSACMTYASIGIRTAKTLDSRSSPMRLVLAIYSIPSDMDMDRCVFDRYEICTLFLFAHNNTCTSCTISSLLYTSILTCTAQYKSFWLICFFFLHRKHLSIATQIFWFILSRSCCHAIDGSLDSHLALIWTMGMV